MLASQYIEYKWVNRTLRAHNQKYPDKYLIDLYKEKKQWLKQESYLGCTLIDATGL